MGLKWIHTVLQRERGSSSLIMDMAFFEGQSVKADVSGGRCAPHSDGSAGSPDRRMRTGALKKALQTQTCSRDKKEENEFRVSSHPPAVVCSQ